MANKILFFLLALAIVCSTAFSLKVETTFKPEGCDAAKKSASGDHLSMHYTGKIDDSSAAGEKGKVFDSSIPRGQPFGFTLGAGNVIKGWDEGLVGMCIGEKRTLVIPPEKGYGDRGAGADIPGGATLNFEVVSYRRTSSGSHYFSRWQLIFSFVFVGMLKHWRGSPTT